MNQATSKKLLTNVLVCHDAESVSLATTSDCGVCKDLKVEECIRIVDATSLMRIKADSHTFMAMADAYRIASNLDE